MAYKLEANHPDLPKGMELDLDGILCKNGGSVEVTEEMEQQFVSKNQRTIKEIYGHSKIVSISGRSELSSKEVEGLIVPEGADVIAVPEPEDDDNDNGEDDDEKEGGEG